jgi:hypothetical protein
VRVRLGKAMAEAEAAEGAERAQQRRFALLQDTLKSVSPAPTSTAAES